MGQPTLRSLSVGTARFSLTALACFSGFLLHCQCAFSDLASPARVFLGRCCRRRRPRHVSCGDVGRHMRSPLDELSRGTSPEMGSPVEALLAALSSVSQPHRHRCCFCSREAWRTAALGICVWLKAGCSSTFLRLGVLFLSFPSAASGSLLSPSELLSTLCVWSFMHLEESC